MWSSDQNRDDTGVEKAALVVSRTCGRDGFRDGEHWVITERPVTLYLNEREMVTLLCAGLQRALDAKTWHCLLMKVA
jgi:hypothetical protein